jgi:biotin carboxylase
MTRRLHKAAPERPDLEALTTRLLSTLGFVRGVTHTEFIRGREDGEFYFLEIASRVGGAHISDVVEAATGVNLWAEWARIEIAGEQGEFSMTQPRDDYAGIVLSLAREEHPDTSSFADPEIWYRVQKHHHIGFVVGSPSYERVGELLADYSRRIAADHLATAPVPDKPTA